MKTIHHLLLSIVLLFVSPILVPSKMSAQTEVAALNNLTLGNYPATMVAVAANTTVTPDAAPTGVASINVSTASNFKGTFVANTTTGVVGITNAHPAGSYVVTVKAFDSVGGMSSQTFALTVVSGTVCNPVQFINAADLTSVSRPNAVAIGDFNNDGIQDIAAAVGVTNTVDIRLGNGSGGFTGSTDVSVSNLSRNVAIGDFNNDGNQDFAASDNGTGPSMVVSIRLGNGAGGFTNAPDVSLTQISKFVAIGDFNSDGREDLAIATFDTVEIRLGDGSGGFTGIISISLGGNRPNYIAIGDFNNDGNQDFATTNQQSVVSIRLGDGLGGFSGTTSVPVGQAQTGVAIGDFNNDGNQDFASAD